MAKPNSSRTCNTNPTDHLPAPHCPTQTPKGQPWKLLPSPFAPVAPDFDLAPKPDPQSVLRRDFCGLQFFPNPPLLRPVLRPLRIPRKVDTQHPVNNPIVPPHDLADGVGVKPRRLIRRAKGDLLAPHRPSSFPEPSPPYSACAGGIAFRASGMPTFRQPSVVLAPAGSHHEPPPSSCRRREPLATSTESTKPKW